MSQSEKHKFEQEWQQAFESAAETPPPSAWEGIEARLDARKSAVVVPLAWWRSPKVLYAAAAVAALLLLSWPALRLSQRDSSGEVAKEKSSSSTEPVASDASAELAVRLPEAAPTLSPEAAPGANTPTRPATAAPEAERLAAAPSVTLAPHSNSLAEVPERSESIAVESQKMRSTPANPSGLTTLPRVSVPEPEQISLAEATDRKSSKSNRLLSGFGEMKKGAPTNGFMPNANATTGQTPTIIAITSSNRHSKPEDVERVIMGSSTEPLRTPALAFSIARLPPVVPAEGAVNLASPAVRYDEAAMPPPRRGRVRELWAGLSFMPALFNPKIDVTSAPAAFSNANASRESLSSDSRGRLSYAIQLQGGKRLSRHWSVETGVSLLQGNSDFDSPGYVLDATTSRSEGLLTNALVTSARPSANYFSAPGVAAFSADQKNGAYIDLDQNTRNDYRFVQVPVQAGYMLNPSGRLSYTLLGGVVANLFVQNQIQDSQGATLKTTTEDGVYRGLNWSATAGVRVSYRLAEHWDATLTGTYQKALASILRDSPTLDSRPQLYGAAWGVRYVF